MSHHICRTVGELREFIADLPDGAFLDVEGSTWPDGLDGAPTPTSRTAYAEYSGYTLTLARQT